MQPLIVFLWAYFGAAVGFIILDGLWLGVIAKKFYFSQLAGLLRDKPDMGVAVVFYIIYLAGIVYFAILPALAGGGLGRAVLNGALLGFFGYMTYDATNLATLKGYPPLMAAVDVAWGTFLTATAAGCGYFAVQRFAA